MRGSSSPEQQPSGPRILAADCNELVPRSLELSSLEEEVGPRGIRVGDLGELPGVGGIEKFRHHINTVKYKRGRPLLAGRREGCGE